MKDTGTSSSTKASNKLVLATQANVKKGTSTPTTNSKDGTKQKTTNSKSRKPTVKKSPPNCSICTSDGVADIKHPLMSCTIYATAEDRLTKLTKMGACTLCGSASHISTGCKFKFNPCSHCSGHHMNFLCSQKVPVTTSTTINQLVQFSVQSDKFDNVVLPTFTVDTSNNCTVRCLLDTGSQSSFITDSTAYKLQLPVLDSDLEVTVLGFNDRKTYHSKLVSIDLIFNGVVATVHALTVPKIRTTHFDPLFSSVKSGFEDLGYSLADRYFDSDPHLEIDLLIGMDNNTVLSFNTVHYGTSSNLSSFLSTPIGIMPTGTCTDILSNIRYLHASTNDSMVSNVDQHFSPSA